MVKTYSKDQIKALLNANDKVVERALLALYECQTNEEQCTEKTIERNGMGFNGVDAKFGSDLAHILINGGALSPRQIQAARKMLQKYVGQLTSIANAKALVKNESNT